MNGSRVTEINDLEIHVLRRMPEQISTWTRSSKQLACLRKKLQYDLNGSDNGSSPTTISPYVIPTDTTLPLTTPLYTVTRIPSAKPTSSHVPCPHRNDVHVDSPYVTAHVGGIVIYSEQINDVSVAKAEAITRRFTDVLMKRANWDRPRQHRTRTERFPYLPGHNLQICKVYIHTTL